MSNDLFKRPQHLVQQSVERMLSQMLKPFKLALSACGKTDKKHIFTNITSLFCPRESITPIAFI